MSKGQEIANELAGASAPANSSQPQGKSATAAIISAVGALAAAGVSAWSAHRSNQRNIDLMHEQNQWNLDQWSRENAYNLPTSQIARLRAAGLNPALIYGEGGIMNESASSQPAADAPTMRSELNIDPLTASQISLNQAEARRLDTQSEIDKGTLDVEQQNLIEFRRQVDGELQRVQSYCNDIVSIINQRNKDFDEKVREFDNLYKIDEEKLKQAWEDLGISKENLRMAIEMFPLMKRSERARAASLFSEAYETRMRGDIENWERRIAKFNYELESILQSQRLLMANQLREGERYRILSNVEEYRMRYGMYGNYADKWLQFNDDGTHDADLWGLYLLSLTNSGAGSSLNPSMFFDLRQPSRSFGKAAKKVLKPKPKPIGFK